MRGRAVVFVVVLLLIVGVPGAVQAHGSVTANSASILIDHGALKGHYVYNTSAQHTSVLVAVTLQRRPGDGGTWVTLDTASKEEANQSGASVFTIFFTRNCANDYRAFGSGNVFGSSVGVHLKASDTSPILQNTC